MAGRKDPDPPVDEPVADEPPTATTTSRKRGDPWSDPCPVCGLLGCRRHA